MGWGEEKRVLVWVCFGNWTAQARCSWAPSGHSLPLNWMSKMWVRVRIELGRQGSPIM